MPIISDNREAYHRLTRTLSLQEAMHQDIRELHILVANLMPSASRIDTEERLGKLLGSTSLQVQIDYFRPEPLQILNDDHFIRTVSQIDTQYDALIVTGANVDRLPFAEVDFLDELSYLIRQDFPVKLGLCWGGMAIEHVLYGTDKYTYEDKKVGIYEQTKTPPGIISPLLRNTNDIIRTPVSRWAGFENTSLTILAQSAETGPYMAASAEENVIVLANHPEYHTDALHKEALRDGVIPANYYPNDDNTQTPYNTWKADGFILWGNLVEHIYDIGVKSK